MRVAHIAYQYGLNNTGGAAIASSRLHQALLAHGVESHYICVHAREAGENVHEMPQGWRRKIFLTLTKLLRGVWKFTPYRKSICLNLIPMFGLEKLLKEIKPDVVHVQWLNADVASYEQIGKLPYLVVFNLHDLNLVLPEGGGYPTDNRYFEGVTRMNTDWLNLWLWRRKGRMIKRLNPTFIGPSKWVVEACAKSINGMGYSGFAISNIIDPIFKYDPTLCKPHDKYVILFGAFGGRGNRFKGWSDLKMALALLPDEMKQNTEVHVFGETAEATTVHGIPLKFLGPISDPIKMREIYHQADVFAFPSVQETQGMTKIEAMLCGLPVIAFDRTACAEGIVNSVSGWVVDDGDVKAFADSLIKQYEMASSCFSAEPICMEIAQRAKAMFGEDEVFSQILKVYHTVVYGREMDRQGNRQNNGNETER